jgi:peroxiredoxin
MILCGMVRAQDQSVNPADVPPILKIRAPAPDFDLPGVDGKRHTLAEYSSAKRLAIVFTCDHCPVAQMYEKRIKQLAADYRDRGVTPVGINPNDPRRCT